VGDESTDGPTNQRTQSLIEVLFAPKNTIHLKLGITIDFVLYRGVLLLQGFLTIKLTTKGLRYKFVTAGILLLKGSLLRGFNVSQKL
jgi:hypothetical protein